MAKEVKRIDIGFHGGQVLPVRVEPKAYEGLREALSDDNAGRWYQLKTQDSEIAVDLSQVVYVRLDVEDGRVGF